MEEEKKEEDEYYEEDFDDKEENEDSNSNDDKLTTLEDVVFGEGPALELEKQRYTILFYVYYCIIGLGTFLNVNHFVFLVKPRRSTP